MKNSRLMNPSFSNKQIVNSLIFNSMIDYDRNGTHAPKQSPYLVKNTSFTFSEYMRSKSKVRSLENKIASRVDIQGLACKGGGFSAKSNTLIRVKHRLNDREGPPVFAWVRGMSSALTSNTQRRPNSRKK